MSSSVPVETGEKVRRQQDKRKGRSLVVRVGILNISMDRNKRDRVGLFNGEKHDVCRRPGGWFEHVQKRDKGYIGQKVFNIELPGPRREKKDHREESLM